MRPQFHHIDARAQLAKARKANERVANESSRAVESRLITQRAHTGDDDELNVEKTDTFMRNAAGERWLKLNYHDEDVSRWTLLRTWYKN
jgi:DNA-directed RNA polymerase-3 subunit RPC5